MARPRLKIDEKVLEELASIGCTTPEMATILACSEDTLERRFAGVIEKGRANLNMSLRRQQVMAANSGNTAMLIWLGKQRLGQSDQARIAVKTDRLEELAEALAKE